MLDQLSDTDAELRPKSAARSGDVGGAVRHLGHEELEAYANGRLAAGRLDYCRSHLDSCEACRAELEDLRLFQSDLSGFQRSESSRSEVGRRKRRRGLALPLTASVVAICAAAVCAVLWLRHERPPMNKNTIAAAATVAQSPVAPAMTVARVAPATPVARAAPTVAGVQTHDTRLTDEVKTPLDRAPLSPRPAAANPKFALLSPLGDTISETRPEFNWQPLPGAIRYSVAIVDARLHPVQRSPALRTTVWRPRRPLRRGRTYLWQVTATLRGGSKVVASAPGMLTESADRTRR